jgi:hypothetical protein
MAEPGGGRRASPPPASSPPALPDNIDELLYPHPDPDAPPEWRRRWTLGDAAQHPADFVQALSRFDRPQYYTEAGRQALMDKTAQAAMGASGGMAGVVRGDTPAANAFVNIIRRTWPRLGEKLDALPDIRVSFNHPRLPFTDPGAGASYTSPEGMEALREALRPGRIDKTPLTGRDAGGRAFLWSKPPSGEGAAHSPDQTTETLLHELLHALYYHKNTAQGTMRGVEPAGPTMTQAQAGQYMDQSGMPFSRQLMYMLGGGPGAPQHGALDAMASRLYRQKFPNRLGNLDPTLHE